MKAIDRCFHTLPVLLQRGKDARHMLKEQLARTGQPHAACGACEQRPAQVFFQFLDSARQRRLLDMQLLRCAGEFFGYGKETAQVTQFHFLIAVLFNARIRLGWNRTSAASPSLRCDRPFSRAPERFPS